MPTDPHTGGERHWALSHYAVVVTEMRGGSLGLALMKVGRARTGILIDISSA